MTTSHFIYIPAIAMLGLILGFILGSRAAADRYNLERKREAEREAARAERAERKAARAAAQDGRGPGDRSGPGDASAPGEGGS